jgi:hypothetical protein
MICGKNMSECLQAYLSWAGAIESDLATMIDDGAFNEFDGMVNLGYNVAKCSDHIKGVGENLRTFSMAVTKALAGDYAARYLALAGTKA